MSGHEDFEDPDLSYCAGDDEIVTDDESLVALAAEYARVEAIEDPDERLEAAKELTARLGGG